MSRTVKIKKSNGDLYDVRFESELTKLGNWIIVKFVDGLYSTESFKLETKDIADSLANRLAAKAEKGFSTMNDGI